MKTIIRTSTTSKTGFELVTIDEKGVEIVTAIDKFDPNNEKSLALPANPSNRKYFSTEKVTEAGGSIELTYKEPRSIGPRDPDAPKATKTPKAPAKGLEEYLTGKDKAAYLELVKKALANKEVAAIKAEIAELTKKLKATTESTKTDKAAE